MTNPWISKRDNDGKPVAARPKLGLRYGAMKPAEQPPRSDAAA